MQDKNRLTDVTNVLKLINIYTTYQLTAKDEQFAESPSRQDRFNSCQY